MTDKQQPEALDLADWLEAVGGGPSAKRCAALLREQHARIAELEEQLESIGACGVSGPLVGRADSKEREALCKIGEEQAFEAWFKVDCPVEGASAKIAAKAAWKARASLESAVTHTLRASHGQASSQAAEPVEREPLTDEQSKALMQAHRTAMLMTCKARVPECGEFAAIAQDLDWLCESLGVKGGQHGTE